MSKLYKIALLITLINVILMLCNTVLTLYVCDRLASADRRIDKVEYQNNKVMNMLQIERGPVK